MRIVFLGATRRGLRMLERLSALAPAAELVVFSFREEDGEPPYLDSIRETTLKGGGRFFEAKSVGADRWRAFWDSTPIDLLLAVNWRSMVPKDNYGRARLGAFVFHDSLLPAYRFLSIRLGHR